MNHRYQKEYENSSLFWKPEPAKYVRELAKLYNEDLSGMTVLDLGAGEGKNAVYLANLGARVTAIDLSEIALGRFRMQPNYKKCKDNLTIYPMNILSFEFENSAWDIIIAYGILHCLDTLSEVENIISKIKSSVKLNGVFIGVTFTNEIPAPEVQEYLNEKSFVARGYMESMFDDWNILSFEYDIIEETHSTSQTSHHHSLVRIMARNNKP